MDDEDEFDLRVSIERNNLGYQVVVRISYFDDIDHAHVAAEEIFSIINGGPSEGEIVH
jgi:hypothetical protein